MFRLLTTTLFVFLFVSVFAQSEQLNDQKQLHINRSTSQITLDGELNEAVWQTAEKATDFYMHAPIDGEPASKKTEVQLTYDERFIYVGITCFDDENYVIQTLKRDQFGDSDDLAVIFDPVNNKANGYGFSVSAYGAQTEALITPGDGDVSWDNRWYSKVRRHTDRWVAEMKIPFKTIRYKTDVKEWGINFVRIEPGENEEHTWTNIPRQFDGIDLGYMGKLIWDEAPQKVGTNVSLIPYITADTRKDFVAGTDATSNLNLGGDAKVAITPTLNLDLTFNPDFSQVEVDRQQTNLTRFNIFFPERRQFFLENADVFNGFGNWTERPFYSRRIGLNRFGQTVPILYGARLSGNLDKNWRIGAFNMHTDPKFSLFGDADSAADSIGQNYSMVSFQRRVLKRSQIKGFFSNRQGYNGSESVENDFGRNLGGEFRYSTADGKWQVHSGMINSMKPGIDSKNNHFYGGLDYAGTKIRSYVYLQHLGENYYSDIGFAPRLNNFNPETGGIERIGYSQLASSLDYYIFPKESKSVNFHWSGLENYVYVNDGSGLNEWYTRLRHFIFFKNTSQLRFRLNNNWVDLLFPFALTSTPLLAKEYNMTEFNIQFNTDRRKNLNTSWFIVYGQFYGGTKLTYTGELAFRQQPRFNLALGLEQNRIMLPDPFGNLNITLATARAEVNFSTNLFWTTFLQYNTQADNFNINSRFQWRFAPMSDLFLVYTDDYAVEGMFGQKRRSLVLKFNYWLTL